MSESEMQADAQYEQQNDDVNVGNKIDNDYASRTGQSQIPVQKDEASIEDPIDPNTADSDATLQSDEKDAIDEGNIINERTRGAQPAGKYQEPSDDVSVSLFIELVGLLVSS